MIRHDALEEQMVARLRELALAPSPELLTSVVLEVSVTSQSRSALRRAAGPGFAWPSPRLLGGLVLLALLVALAVATVFSVIAPPAETYHLGDLAFSDGDHVFVADGDGANPRLVADGWAPQWWGTTLMFLSGDVPGSHLILEDDRREVDLGGVAFFGRPLAAASLDGERLAYLSLDARTLRIRERDGSFIDVPPPDGYGAWLVSDIAALRPASWSLDSRSLLIEACTYRQPGCQRQVYGGRTDLFRVDVDGTTERALGDGMEGWFATYSPDGSRIAFVTYGGTSEWAWQPVRLMVARADGSDPRQIFSGSTEYAWSPDGTRIAVSSGDQRIHVLDPTGVAAPITLPRAQGSGHIVSWSPDGTGVLLSCSGVPDPRTLNVAHPQLVVAHLDGTPPTVLREDTCEPGAWEWLPN